MAFQPIDDDQTTQDETLSAWLPDTVRINVDGCAEDRHIGTGWGYSGETNVRPTVSTHPEQWRNVWTFTAPVYEGAQTMHVRMRYTVALGAAAAGTDAMDVRLSVGGSVGSATTLQVTSAPSSVDLSATIPTTRSGLAFCAVQIRSREASSSVASVNIYDIQHGHYVLTDAPSHSLTAGAAHLCMELTQAGAGDIGATTTHYHIPRIDSTGAGGGSVGSYSYGLHIWPVEDSSMMVGDGQDRLTGAADLIDLGAITVYSYCVHITGTLPSLSLSVGKAQISALRVARIATWRRLQRAARALYQARRRWWAAGVRGDSGSGGGDYWAGYRAASGDIVQAAMCDRRADAWGVEVCMRWRTVPELPSDTDVTITITIRDDAASVLATHTRTLSGTIVPEAGAVEPARTFGPSPHTSLAHYNTNGTEADAWGALDLPEAGEELPLLGGLRVFRTQVEWPSAASAGDECIVEVQVSGGTCHVWDCMLAEVIR